MSSLWAELIDRSGSCRRKPESAADRGDQDQLQEGVHRQAGRRAKGAVITFAASGFPDLAGLLGYVERLKGAAKLRPDSKLIISRDWPSGEARLHGALQISRGLMRVLASGEAKKELEPPKRASMRHFEFAQCLLSTSGDPTCTFI
jgi:hypothetical protein